MFDVYNHESFNNLSTWHADVFNYCKNQDNRFAIVLVGIKNKLKMNSNTYTSSTPIEHSLIQQFIEEKSLIIGYCEVDMQNGENNLKEPFQILFDHFLSFAQSRPSSVSYFSVEFQDYKMTADNSIVQPGSKKSNGNTNTKNGVDKECCTIV